MTDQNQNHLEVDLSLCTGCRACSIVCALSHENRLELYRARIQIVKNLPDLEKPVFTPKFCMMCRDAACVAVCPTTALSEDGYRHLVILDPSLCNGCGLCVEACPFNAIWLDKQNGISIKCDLCGGDPICVKYCPTDALAYLYEKKQ
jgi:anaerobic carbon-monoxide dehydrogenase iron sulfur subunit